MENLGLKYTRVFEQYLGRKLNPVDLEFCSESMINVEGIVLTYFGKKFAVVKIDGVEFMTNGKLNAIEQMELNARIDEINKESERQMKKLKYDLTKFGQLDNRKKIFTPNTNDFNMEQHRMLLQIKSEGYSVNFNLHG